MDAPLLTHEVLNQPPPFEDVNLFRADPALAAALAAFGAGHAAVGLAERGAELGSAEWQARAERANRCPPRFHSHDRQGRRIDELEFDPAYHALLGYLKAHGLDSAPWTAPGAGAQAARAAHFYLYGQLENGTQCPITMSYAAIPLLAREPRLAEWRAALCTREHDPRGLPLAAKRGALLGMGLTEKQGGSDLRAITTRAEPAGDDGVYRLIGHKWFFSAPASDAHLVLALTAGGPSCLLLPRFLPDGSRNAVRIQRLKDKLGDRANASAEVEFHGALAWRLGEEGRGIALLAEMAAYTRIDCVLGSAGLMRAALARALHHARHRRAFGRALADQPLMRALLADLALEAEASMWLALRLAHALDRAAEPAEALLARVLTPAAKYHVCRRGPGFAFEAMEALGGNGYVEDFPLARLYRQAPVNSIWEGSGNVMCLDVLRALGRAPETRDALAALWHAARGRLPGFDAAADALLVALRAPDEADARRLAERIAVLSQAALLAANAPPGLAAAFAAARLAPSALGYGALPADAPCAAILARALATD